MKKASAGMMKGLSVTFVTVKTEITPYFCSDNI